MTQAQWYVYRENGHHFGPLAAETLAGNVLGGALPKDAYIFMPGDAQVRALMSVEEIARAVQSLEARKSSTPPPPPVREAAPQVAHQSAPPPPVQAAPAVAEAAPAPAAPKPEEKKAPVLSAKYKLLPVGIFAMFCFIALVEVGISFALDSGSGKTPAAAQVPAKAK